MYLFKNSFRNMCREKGKNILIGIIITVVTICTCIGLSIYKAGKNLVNVYRDSNALEVSFSANMGSLRNAEDAEKSSFQSLTEEDVINYADSSLVKDYYYTLEASLSSSEISAISDLTRPSKEDNAENMPTQGKEKFGNNMGDFRLTAYSNFSYLNDFETGAKKIVEGSMITGEGEEQEIVISKDLADENNLAIEDEITFYLPNDEAETFSFKIVGIYEIVSSDDDVSFLNVNALNTANQIYTNLTCLNDILAKQEVDDTLMFRSDGLQARFYLNDNDDLSAFEEEVRSKGLSSYYEVTTNESEILKTLQPIQNISSFSKNFLIVIIIVAIVVLTVINFLNIRDRKYEIGVLRAIGMSKKKVTIQFVLEIFYVACFSLILGTFLGMILSQPVTNKMLENEINSYQEKVITREENFGSANFNRPSENMQMGKGENKNNNNSAQSLNYVDSLKINIDAMTILQLFGVGLILTISSTMVSVCFINKYNPNRILQNR